MSENQRIKEALVDIWDFAQIPVGGLSIPANASTIIVPTSTMQDFLAVAVAVERGGSGQTIALQEAVLTQGARVEGVTTDPVNNLVHLFEAGSGRLKDADGTVIYGRLTKVSTDWTITLYSDVNGTETVYTNGVAPKPVTGLLPCFAPGEKIGPAAQALASQFIESSLNMVGGSTVEQEILTIVTNDVLPPLTKATPTKYVNLFITHAMFSSMEANPIFTYSGKVLTFTAANIPGGTLKAGTLVLAQYA